MSTVIPPVIGPAYLAELQQTAPSLRLLDVRTAAEFEAAHIPGSYNVPLDTLAEHAREIHGNVSEPVVLVCQSGGRARRAEEALKGAGMPNLHVLQGGVNGWIAEGRQVTRGRVRMSLERQVRIAAGAVAAAGGFLALGVHPWFAALPAVIGTGLVAAGITDTCLLGMLLARLPYNRASCDVGAMVRALVVGSPPASSGSARTG